MTTLGFVKNNLNNPQTLITNAANMVFTQPAPQNNFSFSQNTPQVPSFGNIDDFSNQNNNFNYSYNNQQKPFGGAPIAVFQPAGMGQPNQAYQSNSFTGNTTSNFGFAQNQHSNNNFASGNGFLGSKPEQPMKPFKSKNPKLDNKHLVKCITMADANSNMCIKELRIKYILQSTNSSGQFGQPNGVFGTPPTSSFGFGNYGSPQKQTTLPSNSGLSFMGSANPIISTPTKSTNTFNINNNAGMGFTNAGNKSQFSFNTSKGITPISSNNSTFAGQNPTPSFGSFAPNSNPSPFANSFSSNTSQFGQPTNFQSPTFSFPQTNENKGVFAPADNNSVTVFPKLLANPTFTPAINNAAISLATNIVNPAQNYPNQFQTQPNMGQNFNPNNGLGYENSVMNSFFNSQFFKKIITENNKDPYDKLSDDVKRKNSFSDRIFKFGEEELDEDYLLLNRSKKNPAKIQLIQKPYLFNEVQIDNYYYQAGMKTQEKFKKEFKPTQLKMKSDEILKKSFLEEFQQNFNKFQEKTLKQIVVKPSDLPVNDLGIILSPNLDQLAGLTTAQLKKVTGVSIENKFGKIKFWKPINLLAKKLSQCIKIEQDVVEILDPQWSSKECEISFKNFSNYLKGGEVERRKTERKIKKWADKNNLQIQNFDKETGNLIVTLN